MLSAFKPQAVVELKARNKFKIDSILSYGDRLLVGLSNGSLRVYRINERSKQHDQNTEDQNDAASTTTANDTQSDQAVDLLREYETFSRKSVQQLAVFKEANILISLSENYVSLHELSSFDLSDRLEKTKGAIAFAAMSHVITDPETGYPSIISKLAVPVKRRLYLWSWQDSELVGAEEEITLPNAIKSVIWANGDRLLIGMDSGYTMIDLESRDHTEIMRPVPAGENTAETSSRFGAINTSGINYMGMSGWVPKPLAAKLGEGGILLAKDVNSLFIDESGQAVPRRQVPWHTAPEAIGYSYPYLLSLQTGSKASLEIRNPITVTLLQTIPLPNALHLHVPRPNISLAHAGKGFLVANERCVWQMDAVDYISQIEELKSKTMFDEALSLLDILEDTLLDERKDERVREVKVAKSHWLFDRQQFREALELFAEAEAPPAHVVSLYPPSIAGDVSATQERNPAVGDAADSSPITEAASDEPQTHDTKSKTAQRNKTSGSASEETTADERSDAPRGSPRKKGSALNTLEGKTFKYAVNELNAFLAQNRVQLKRYINFDGTLRDPEMVQEATERPPFANLIAEKSDDYKSFDWASALHETAILVDTTLFRGYMLTNPRLAGPLFRLDNFCASNVVQEKLAENGRYDELIDFLRGKRLHEKALTLLRDFGQGRAEEDIDKSFEGPRRTVKYLQQLTYEDIDIILEFARWPLEVDQRRGMQVFLADTENSEMLPRGRVLGFLNSIGKVSTIRFLEHIVFELHDRTDEFHEELAAFYMEVLVNGEMAPSDEMLLEQSHKTWEERLLDLVRSSGSFNKAALLEKMPRDKPKFFEARAVLHGRLFQHRQALEIYVFQAKDHTKAEDYCNNAFKGSASTTQTLDLSSEKRDESGASEVFNLLLSLYVEPPAPHTADFAAALGLLSRHGSRISALEALSSVPSSVSVTKLEDYFIGRMRAATSVLREKEIIRALSDIEKQDADARLVLGNDYSGLSNSTSKPTAGRNRRIVIGEDKTCSVCHRRFGTSGTSAILVWPDGECVHHGCTERRRLGGVRLSG